MSIKDPWPLLFSPAPSSENRQYRTKFITCRYSKRYSLPCGTNLSECENCYMYQMDRDDKWNRSNRDKWVTHICDRCGRDIESINQIVYLSPENRAGQIYFNKELCFRCARSFFEWVDLPKTNPELFDIEEPKEY